jgi:GT2 family glycosyltransferase
MAHLLVVRKSLGDSVGWLNSRYDGSQDYDLALKLSEKTSRIYHIPKVLYHWKEGEGSTASSISNKSYAVEAGERALEDHLLRCGQGAHAEPGSYPYQARYPIHRQPKISMIIPNRDNSASLKRLLDSIFEKSTYPDYEILIVENGSQAQETFAFYDRIRSNPRIKILEWKEPFNYSLINNFGEEHASGEIILLLNNDVEVITPNWIERMLEHALRPEIGAVGAKLYFPDGTIQHAGVIVGMFGLAGHAHKGYPHESPGYYNRLISIQNYSALTAACLMLRREVFQEVNGLDPAFRLEFGDVDFCLRILERGYRNLWTPYAELYHYESLTRGGYDTREKKALNAYEVSLFKSRWSEFLAKGDPSYNPNLTQTKEDFSYNMFD